MLYFSTSLQDYDVDEFTLPVQAGGMTINIRFAWPVELQRQYDDLISRLDNMFQSIPLVTVDDMDNIERVHFSFELINAWQQFVTDWESGTSVLDLVNSTQWPNMLKSELQAYLDDNTDTGLYTNIKSFLTTIQPNLDYLDMIDRSLIWSITTEYGGDTRVACVNSNIWLYQGFNDYRLCFSSLKHRIGRNDLRESTLYIALGDGDV